MLESIQGNTLEYQRLSKEEMERRGILGRLIGICADITNPTRNGRLYSETLWEQVFNSPLMKERIENGVCYGELGHPADREETDIEKIAVCLAEIPKKGRDGKLRAVFDILDTPNGRILKSLCDYGSTLGISSRGSGDLISDWDGQESVDPDTYNCEGFDIVLLPAVKEARLRYVNESLDKTRYKKTLRSKLQESLDKASDSDRKIMSESLNSLGIHLNESCDSARVADIVDYYLSNDNLEFPELVTAVKTQMQEEGSVLPTDDAELERIINTVIDSYNDEDIFNEEPELDSPFSDEVLESLNEENKISSEDIENYKYNLESLPEDVRLFLDTFYNVPWIMYGQLPDGRVFYEDDENSEIYDSMDDFIEDMRYNMEQMCEMKDDLYSPDDEEYQVLTQLCNPDNFFNESYKNKSITKNNNKFVVEGMEFNSLRNAKSWIDMNAPTNESLTKASYVTQLDQNTQDEIKADLVNNGISGKDLDYAMNSRIVDLEDTIDINKYLTEEQVGRDMMDNDKSMSDVLQPETEEDNNRIIIENANEILDYDEEVEEALSRKKIYKEERSTAVGNTEADINALQESLKNTIKLEKQVAKLQEKLSASYARENKLKEDAGRYKNQIQQLAKKSKEIEVLTEKLSVAEKQISEMENHSTRESNKLQESLTKKEQVTSKLTESVRDRDSKIKSLQEALNKANEQEKKSAKKYSELEADYSEAQKDLAQLKESYSKKLEQSNQLVEKYKNIAKNSVGKYIDSQATRLGVTSNEIKSRLPKNYNFKDIDSICESLQEYKLNINSLSFNPKSSIINEGISLRAKNVSKDFIPVNEEDEITDFDLKFAAQACK